MTWGFESMFEEMLEDALKKALSGADAAGLSEDEFERMALSAGEAVPKALLAGVPMIVESLKQSAPGMLEARRGDRLSYSGAIRAHWSKAFDLYECVLKVAGELGEEFSAARFGKPAKSRVGPVVARIQGRACRTAEEVMVLMQAGFAQGALARWRALHEMSVVASFIAKHGDEIAGRYVAHEAVERYWGVQDYIRCQPALGYEPLDPGDIESAQAEFEAVLAEFGENFKRQYGWASPPIQVDPELRKLGGFMAMEKDVELDHLRAHYRHASHPVHPQSAGTLNNPDLMPELSGAVLTGPSPRGMADPGHNSLISLTQITSTLLLLGSPAAAIIGSQILLDLTDEAGRAFIEAHEELEEAGAAGFGA